MRPAASSIIAPLLSPPPARPSPRPIGEIEADGGSEHGSERGNCRPAHSADVLISPPLEVGVAQLLVRSLEDDVKAKLQQRVRRHGRSTEEEVRDILRAAA